MTLRSPKRPGPRVKDTRFWQSTSQDTRSDRLYNRGLDWFRHGFLGAFAMALGDGHSMSSSSTLTATATSSPSSTQSSEDTGGAKGANYFFGFLITFIALLFIFIGCGVTTRRRLQRRRIINLDALASMPGFFGSRAGLVIDEKDKPLLCERWTERAEEPTWACMQVCTLSPSSFVVTHQQPRSRCPCPM